MKLYRSDLEQFISNQLFEIPADTLGLGDLQLAGDIVRCVLSVESAAQGYRVHGQIDTDIEETCDRCLNDYKKGTNSSFNLILTEDKNLLKDQNMDVIPFSESEEYVDLTSLIHDLVLLAEPFKRLCNQSCKGLCSQCGIDLNKNECNCRDIESDSRWDTLKHLKN